MNTADDVAAMTRSIATVMRETIAKSLNDLDARLRQIEQKFAALPIAERGERGEPGPPGQDGVAPSLADVVAAVLPRLRVPVDGKDGAPGEKGERGEQGPPGVDAAPAIDDVVAAVVASIRLPEDGVDGRNGVDGRDALDLDILPAIDDRKHYPRGTYAMHRGGLWKSFTTTDAMKGWECLIVGTVEQRFEQRSARDFAYVVENSLGVKEFPFSIPTPIDVGVYKADTPYQQGDGVTYGGSWWLAQRDTTDKPGESDAWRLTVKRGRDGKDGERGPEGKVIRVREKDGSDRSIS